MKFFLYLILFAFLLLDRSQAQSQIQKHLLSFNKEKHSLKLKGKNVPSWLTNVVVLSNPKVQFGFIRPFSNNYPLKGWFRIAKIKNINKLLNKTTSYKVPKEFIDRGWFYSKVKVTNPPSKNWFYSTNYHLYFNAEGILRLNNYFKNSLTGIYKISPHTLYKTTVNEILRIVIPIHDNNIRQIKLDLPYNWVTMYESTLSKNPFEKTFIIQSYIKPTKPSDTQTLRLKIEHNHSVPTSINYLISFKNSDLEF